MAIGSTVWVEFTGDLRVGLDSARSRSLLSRERRVAGFCVFFTHFRIHGQLVRIGEYGPATFALFSVTARSRSAAFLFGLGFCWLFAFLIALGTARCRYWIQLLVFELGIRAARVGCRGIGGAPSWWGIARDLVLLPTQTFRLFTARRAVRVRPFTSRPAFPASRLKLVLQC